MAAPSATTEMTDITGYRTDGGGLGQSQGLTDQLRRVLMAKLPLLNAPGTVLENTLYYDTNSSQIEAVEAQSTFAKDKIAFSSTAFGAAATAYIPSVLFAGQAWIVGSLPEDWKMSANNDGRQFYLPEGWGFDLIRNLIVYMGASSIAQISISGKTNYMVCMACCESESKRRVVVRGAGGYCNINRGNAGEASTIAPVVWTDPTPAGQPQGGNSSFLWKRPGVGNGILTNAVRDGSLSEFCVPIRLPWCSMAAINPRLSLDTKLLTQPIQIVADMKSFHDVCTSNMTQVTAATNYRKLTLQMWQEELSDKSLSVRNELLAMPEFNVGLPFQYAQSTTFTPAAGDIDPNNPNSQLFRANLTSIINSDLTTFLFMVVEQSRDSKSVAGVDYTDFNPLLGEELLDMEIQLNGQNFFRFDQGSYTPVTAVKHIADVRHALPVNYGKAREGVDSVGRNANAYSYIYEVNNSKLRALANEAYMQNTARFTNQTFQMQFRINRGKLHPTRNAATKEDALQSLSYTIHCCYLYNGVFLIGGDGGTTKLITN